jgi:hypothetical protein
MRDWLFGQTNLTSLICAGTLGKATDVATQCVTPHSPCGGGAKS